jgi:iron complex outermembrane recepter protein
MSSFRDALHLTGPLNDNGTISYRFIAAAQTAESFIDFLFDRRYVVAPTVAINFSDSTSLNIWGEYSRVENSFDQGLPAVGTVLPNPFGEIPRDRNLTDPDNFNVDEAYRLGFDVQHRFNDDWQIRSAFLASFYNQDRDFAVTIALLDDNRTVTRRFGSGSPVYSDDLYNFDTYITGNFLTGSVEHQLTAGINLRWTDSFVSEDGAPADPIDIFDPVYIPPTGSYVEDPGIEYDSRVVGFYVQDQITLLDNLKLLLRGRFDFANQEQRNLSSNTEVDDNYQEFSPRVGIVYQPIQPISLYASYSRSFSLPDAAFSDLTLEPEFGTQYEIGVKAEINDRLAANLAVYDLTRSNLSTADPNDPQRTIQVGEQRSRQNDFFCQLLLWRISSETENSFIGSVLSDAGLQRPPSQQYNPKGYISFSEENLHMADGDVMFVVAYGGNETGERDLNLIQQKPLWKKLKAVQQNHVYYVDPTIWRGRTPLAADAIIDDLYKYLVNAP